MLSGSNGVITMKKVIIASLIMLGMLIAVPAVVVAQDIVTIPVSTIARGGEGTEKVLITKQIPNGEYKVTVEATNQESVHPNTDIIVRSGPAEATVIRDVERRAFQSETSADTLIVQNGEVVVSVKFGRDKVFSGGVKVTLTEVPPIETEEPTVPQTSSTNTEEGKVLPASLPKTGAESMLVVFSGASGVGYAVHAASRKLRRQ